MHAGPLSFMVGKKQETEDNVSTELELQLERRSDRGETVSGDFVLSELIQQIPNLTGTEALPLSQMITDQLRRWKRSLSLRFRRTKIVEKASKASVTIIDFECVSAESQEAADIKYAGTVVMSDIINRDMPSEQIGCLWAPAYDGKDPVTFRKESTHLLSVLRLCWEGCTYNERMRTSVAATAITDLFSKHFTEWAPNFSSQEAALLRACAWGFVAANTSKIEYRLFAASMICLLNSQINSSLATSSIEAESPGNDLCFTLIPYFRVLHIELGKHLENIVEN